jgi:hypothetical protein
LGVDDRTSGEYQKLVFRDVIVEVDNFELRTRSIVAALVDHGLAAGNILAGRLALVAASALVINLVKVSVMSALTTTTNNTSERKGVYATLGVSMAIDSFDRR